MADIRLARPAAGASESVACEPSARFVFDFPATDATLARDGDNLTISFEDGSKLRLEGFYQEYNSDNLPSFSIDGTEVAAADFFEAMNEPDLMPAAGPGAGTVANGARFHEWGDASLAAGIQHLDGLDWGFSRAFEWEDHPNAVGYNDDDDDGGLAGAVGALRGGLPDGPARPGQPGRPVPPDHPVTITPDGDPDPGKDDYAVFADGGVLNVHDAGMPGGSRAGDAATAARGRFTVEARDGVGSITVTDAAGTEVSLWENGHFVPKTLETPEGSLSFTGFENNVLSYEFVMARTGEHTESDLISHGFTVAVTDTDGDSASSTITVNINDDDPRANRDFDYVVEGSRPAAEGNVVAGSHIIGEAADPSLGRDHMGADGLDRVEWGEVRSTEYVREGNDIYYDGVKVGTLETLSDGGYAFRLAPGYDVRPGGLPDFEIAYTAFDKDGDEAPSSLTIKVRGEDHGTPPGPGEGGEPGTGAGPEPLMPSRVITVKESGLEAADGTQVGSGFEEGATISGVGNTLDVRLAGDGTITFGKLTFEIVNGEVPEAPAESAFTVNGVTLLNVHLEKIDDAAEGEPNWKVVYDYRLTENVTHTDPHSAGAADNLSAAFAVAVKAKDGGQSVGSVVINVHDDRPEITVTREDDDDYSGTINTVFGADHPAAESITVTVNGRSHVVDLAQGDEIKGDYGRLTIHGDGSYTYTPYEGKYEDGTDTFGLKIEDSDGDTATDQLVFATKAPAIPITVTVGTEGKDTIDGDRPGDDSGLVPGSQVLDPAHDIDASHDIVIADIAGFGTQPGQSYNLAFLVDNSMSIDSLDLETMKGQLTSVIDRLSTTVNGQEFCGDINILILGFHTYTSSYLSINLKEEGAVEKLHAAINVMKVGYHWSNEAATNYELAFNQATAWFKEQDAAHPGTNAINQTFFITDGEPSVHVDILNGTKHTTTLGVEKIKNINGYDSTTGEITLGGYTPGVINSVYNTDGTLAFKINEKGLLIDDKGALLLATNPVAAINPSSSLSGKPFSQVPLIAFLDNDGEWKVGVPSGYFSVAYEKGSYSFTDGEGNSKMTNNYVASDALPAAAALKVVCPNVIGIGFGKEAVPDLPKYVKEVAANGLSVDGISSAVLGSMIELDPAADKVDGGKGRDILFGDRLVDATGEGAEQANVGELRKILNLEGTAEAATFLAELADQYADVAKYLDTHVDPDGAKGGNDILVGGGDSDLLFGMGGDDILIGDGTAATAQALDEINVEARSLFVTGAPGQVDIAKSLEALDEKLDILDRQQADDRDGDDRLFGGHGNDILYGGGGDDFLDGGTGEDVLIGGTGDDYLDGGAGRDYLMGGEGNDLIVYDAEDYLVSGGEGIDFLLAGREYDGLSLGTLLDNANPGKTPLVESVEVLLKGLDDTASLTSMGKLADSLGLRLEKGADGQDRLVVDMDQWTKDTDDGVTTWKHLASTDGENPAMEHDGITMETANLELASQTEHEAVLVLKSAAENGV